MRPVYQTIQLSATSAAFYAASQKPLAAGNLTLTGAAPVGAEEVSITSDADDSARTFTVYGTNAEGLSISATVTGPNTTTVNTTAYFATVTRIAVDAATAGNITAGIIALGAGPWIPVDYIQAPFNVSFGCVVGSGTVNYTVQYAFDDPFADTPTFTPFDHAFVAAQTTNKSGNFSEPIRECRVKINSGSDPVTVTWLQGLSA